MPNADAMERLMKFMWIDPGETVGYAYGEVVADRRAKGDKRLKILKYGQDKAKTFIMNLPDTMPDLAVVGYETYNITAKDLQAHLGSNVPTLQVIGMIRSRAWDEQDRRASLFPRILTQAPADKRTGMAAAQLWAPNLVPIIQDALDGPHDEGHYGDALMHAIAWFHFNHDMIKP